MADSPSCPHLTLQLSQATLGAPSSPGPLANDAAARPVDFITKATFPQLRHVCGLSPMSRVLTSGSQLFTLQVGIIPVRCALSEVSGASLLMEFCVRNKEENHKPWGLGGAQILDPHAKCCVPDGYIQATGVGWGDL